ncbi:hypothetical protein F4805DRAFT_472892 [Annulohypoxylon moriforme]|nr:hypothetical protein F4805DRAFT_472892 [Annulohypoxylon moriforme]
MASDSGSQSQQDIKLTIREPVETPSEAMSQPYDEMDIDNENNSGSATPTPINEINNTKEIEIKEVSRTPTPDIDPERYATWGRKHFGEEWYQLRSKMLNERDIFASRDPIYQKRQNELRMLERQVEGRTFMLPCGMDGKPCPLSGKAETDTPSSSMPLSSDADLFGSSQASTRTIVPPTPDDPWERLEHYRRHLQWDDLEYHIEIELLKEALLDLTRNKRDDAEGDLRREQELDEMHELTKGSWQYKRQKVRYQRHSLGWSQKRIEEEERKEVETLERFKELSSSQQGPFSPQVPSSSQGFPSSQENDVIEPDDGEEDSDDDFPL